MIYVFVLLVALIIGKPILVVVTWFNTGLLPKYVSKIKLSLTMVRRMSQKGVQSLSKRFRVLDVSIKILLNFMNKNIKGNVGINMKKFK